MTDTTPPTHIQLSENDFFERFKPIRNHLAPDAPFDGCMFETYGPEREFVREHDTSLVWTIVDCDGELFIESGAHYVNRFGYLIASVPHDLHEHFTVGDEQPVTVPVSRRHLRFILDYLRESEEEHYEETIASYPDDANEHVFWHVLAIEKELEALS